MPAALSAVSRRAIALQSVIEQLGFLGGDLLLDLACVIDLPRPCSALTLEVAAGHDLRFAGAQQGDPTAPGLEPLPPGPSAALTFATPVTELRLAGNGSLYAIRTPVARPVRRRSHARAAPSSSPPSRCPTRRPRSRR